jgi:pyruvate-formate lyase-activating enzyme
MPKQNTESYQEYRDRAINPISPSFCGAKWYNATVWLGSGMTASCHHPPAHKVPLEELKQSYKALHNTKYKKLVREQMLRGERPEECDYCWKIEDLGQSHVSDRVFKSVIYTDDELKEAAEVHGSGGDVDLKTLEIAFDATCNFACSYCNPSFSTTWMKDIRTEGPYTNLVSDGAGAFQQDGSWAQPYGIKNEDNPYVAAFMEWWENDLQHSLQELRITGGEATMSQDFWKLMDWWKEHPECNVTLAVNSNLGAIPRLMDRLCETSHSFKNFQLYTSNESFGAHSEYIRDGLIWDTWLSNIHKMMTDGNVKNLNMMMTINSLCLFSITEFMDEMIKIKEKYGKHHAMMSFNILRFPSFQSALALPEDIRYERAAHIEDWLKHNWFKQPQTNNGRGMLHQMEYDGLERLISYLYEVEEGHNYTSSIETRQRDFKSFFMQYDKRRGKNFVETFPMLADWYDSLPVTKMIPIKMISGDATEGQKHVGELIERANKEGWILEPAKANPGSQDYVEPKKKELKRND